MPKTQPWTPEPPVWEWNGISERFRARAKERYAQRSSAIESDGQARGPAELRAYCELVEVMHEKGVFNTEHIRSHDVIRQLHRAENFKRHDAIGRRILAGTWPKREKGEPPRTI